MTCFHLSVVQSLPDEKAVMLRILIKAYCLNFESFDIRSQAVISFPLLLPPASLCGTKACLNFGHGAGDADKFLFLETSTQATLNTCLIAVV